jgi:hypothetical protein
MTAHGLRAMASTLLNESGKWNPDAIERALAHADGDKVRAAYHRGAHWQERAEMAPWWSDYLDQLHKSADVVPFPDCRATIRVRKRVNQDENPVWVERRRA